MKPKLNDFNKIHVVLMVLTVIYLAASFVTINTYRGKLRDSRADAIRRSIEKAAVQCYALEGNYPPDLKYLEENYGIQIHEDKYHYDYFAFASNIRPVIVVVEKAGFR
ncbi:MAG: hypothetical protein ACOYEQ_09865 [Bacillota bacterium]